MEARLAQIEEELKTATGDKLNYLSAEFATLNTRFASEGGLHYKSRCRSFLVRLGFPEEFHDMPIEKCSGGQRTRLALAPMCFMSKSSILIMGTKATSLKVR